ncbi:MAG: hypothetical protein H0T48_10065 [Gemmatimonadaceae bacterium]|nr:hypothetical protein [Gemmatimonadaceae bacterium]
MAPVVHGLEQQYENRVDFVFLDTSDPQTTAARQRLGFKSTPHFFFLLKNGSIVTDFQGVVPRDSLVRSLDRLLERGELTLME